MRKLKLFRLCSLFSLNWLPVNDPKSSFLYQVIKGLGSDGMVNFLIDSGAYSNYTARKRALNEEKSLEDMRLISLKDYIELIHGIKDSSWGYISLDVLRDAAATKKNLADIQKSGLIPMPVLTSDASIESVHELIEVNRFFCVAGAPNPRNRNIIHRYNAIVDRFPRACIHALGYSRYPEMLSSKVLTTDSSSWQQGAMYGTIQRYDPVSKRIRKISRRDLSYSQSRLSASVKRSWIDFLVTEIGVSIDRLESREAWSSWRTGVPAITGSLAWLKLFNYIKKSGISYFFAAPGVEQFNSLIAILGAYDFDNEILDYAAYVDIMERQRIYTRAADVDSYLGMTLPILHRTTTDIDDPLEMQI